MVAKPIEPENPREVAIKGVLKQISSCLQAAIDANLPHVAIAVGKAMEEARLELEALEGDRPINSGHPFTPETLAARWSCSAKHIRTLIRAGKLDGFYLGGQLLRIPAAEVRRFEREGLRPDPDVRAST